MLSEAVILHQVGSLAFGQGVSLRVATDLAAAGARSALIVTTPPIRKSAERLAEIIAAGGIGTVIWDDYVGEPAIGDFERLLAFARGAKIDAVIGMGGGSSMDLAKLVAALLPGGQSIRDVQGTDKLLGRQIWLACIPTTAGTGSEVSPIAILLDETDVLKKGVISRHLVPDAAYVDPLLTVSMPAAVTAATGLDALTHCIEAYANRFAHPVVDNYALEGIRLISRSLVTAVHDGTNLAARTDMARASLYGGLCLGPVNTAAVHALAYPLGGEFHVAHGVSNALLLNHVLAFNLTAAEDRYSDIALALGAPMGASTAATAHNGLQKIESMVSECEIPLRLSDHGVTADALDRMTDGAMTVTRLLERNVREVTWQDARAIYQAAF
ncbi:MAG: iron-containing alcohol dehydrogenase [Pseudomonadota bacterium]